MPNQSFLSQAAPDNYVAGLGRGATGFTTRSDLGPAREGPSEEQFKAALSQRARDLGAPVPTAYGATEKPEAAEDDDERFQDPDNEVGLFAGAFYDKNDDEADRIWQSVDDRMAKRRKKQRESREEKEREEYERQNPKLSEQFADLKRSLSTLTEEDWEGIPEAGDLTGRNKRKRAARMQQRSYAVPDSVLAAAQGAGQLDTSISASDGQETAEDTMMDFAQIGTARKNALSAHLDRAERNALESSGTATTVDAKGYLTSLDNQQFAGGNNVGDIARTRLLLQSVIKTNPKHAPGWISAARLEELAGKTGAAKSLINRGCENCPKSEDVWIEAIRLHMGEDSHNSKVIAANAIQENPKSTKLWMAAMELESNPLSKKKVARKALERIPQSVALWKAISNLETDPKDARLLLAKATEFVPLSVELWLALARLEDPENARKVLNKARKAVPTSHEVWIAACRLEEQLDNASMVRKVMERGIKSLAKESAMLKREEWIAEAQKVEEEGAPLTCAAIIEYTLGWDLDEDDDRKDTWMADAKESLAKGCVETARAIYAYALRVFYNKRTIWQAAAELERSHGKREALLQLLDKAVEACPQSDELWLQLAKEKWQMGEVDAARIVLARAFKQNPSENIFLAAVKFEADSKNFQQARDLLAKAREQAGTDRVWIKSVAFERQQGDIDAAISLVDDGLQRYPKAAKLWMMKGQIYESKGDVAKVREAYRKGTELAPKSVPLWLLASRFEEKQGVIIRARAILDRARLAVPKSDELWVESVRLERRAKKEDVSAANHIMNRALQALPNSGLLWSEKIMHLEERTKRRQRALEAIKRNDQDKLLFITVARIFWAERKLEKAANWFEKAILMDEDWGDSWAWYYKFLMQHGTEEKKKDVVFKCVQNEPRHGEVWQRIRKDPKHASKSLEEILMMTVAQLE